jgi:hypothetical protein
MGARCLCFVLAIAASGYVYSQLGGRYGSEMTVSTDQLLPLLAAIAVYVAVKGLIGGAGNAFAAGRGRGWAFRSWFEEHLAGDLIVLPVGPLLALTQVRIGPVGVALFLLPLLFARYVCNLWSQTRAPLMLRPEVGRGRGTRSRASTRIGCRG